MRTQLNQNVTLYYPNEIVYLRDFNSVGIVVNDDVHNIENGFTANIVITIDGDSITLKSYTLKGNTITFDISYLLQQYNAGSVISNINATITIGGDTITISETNTCILRNGYSLPNRQHFSETDVYIPPLEVYRAGFDSEATQVEAQFSTTQPVVVNGRRYSKNANITLTADAGCTTEVEVVTTAQYNHWLSANNANTYGINTIWIEHVYFDDSDKYFPKLFKAKFPHWNDEWDIVKTEDRFSLLSGNFYVWCGLILQTTSTIGAYQIIGLTYSNNVDPYYNVVFLPQEERMWVRTDGGDDFLTYDYGHPNGIVVLGYNYGHGTEQINMIENQVYFCIYNDYNPLIGIHTKSARGSILFGVNSTKVNHDLYTEPAEALRDMLGISINTISRTDDDKHYDYSFHGLYDNMTPIDCELRCLHFGATSGFSPLNLYWYNIMTNTSVYASLHQSVMDSVLTLFPESLGGEIPLEYRTPVYALWKALTYNTSNPLNCTCMAFDDYSTTPRFIPFTDAVSMKQTDNAISTNPQYLGSSFVTLDNYYIRVDLQNNILKIPVTNYRPLLLTPNPIGNGSYRSSAFPLFQEDATGNREFYDENGNVLTNIYTEDPFNPPSDDFDYPIFVTLTLRDMISDIYNAGLIFENVYLSGNRKATLYRNPTYQAQKQMSAYYFPYNCSMPPYICEQEPLKHYSIQYQQVDWIIDVYTAVLCTNRCVVSPFNVGRTVFYGINEQVYQTANTTGTFSNERPLNTPPLTTVIRAEDGQPYTNAILFQNDLLSSLAVYSELDISINGRRIVSTPDDGTYVISSPCTKQDGVYHSATRGRIFDYTIVLNSICDADNVFWLKYENMDGFVRWLPFEIKRQTYTNEVGEINFVKPFALTGGNISSYPLQSPLSFSEKIVCYIGDVPAGCYIEDILYSPYLIGYSSDGSVEFSLVLEENEIVRDITRNVEDFVFTFIKKR